MQISLIKHPVHWSDSVVKFDNCCCSENSTRGCCCHMTNFEAELKGCPLKMFFVFSGLEAGDIMEISSKENAQLFSNNTILPVDRSSFKSESSTSKEKQSCCGGIKVE